MKWKLALGAGLLAATLGAPGGAGAQEMGSAWAPRFELGVYGGGAFTSEWYQSRMVTSTDGIISDPGDGEGFGFGFTPAFGGAATLYLSPMLGLRAHYGYVPSALPQADDADATLDQDEDSWVVNNHFYDLSLVLRPWAARSGGLMAQTYLFVGGGGLTTDVAGSRPEGTDRAVCEAFTLAQGACLPIDGEHASVGQGTAGIGVDLFALSRSIGVFAELATHVYDSPVHVGSGFVPDITVAPGEPFAVADDMYATTSRLVLGVKLGFGGFGPMMAPTPPMAPAPPPAPMAPPAPPPAPPAPAMRDINVCVVTDSGLQNVAARVNPANNDTTAMGQAFSSRYPASAPMYAAGTTWFINTDTLRLGSDEFVKFGVSRMITNINQLRRVGDFQGTPLFAETGATAPYQVLYVPLRPGCEFQPYSPRPRVRG